MTLPPDRIERAARAMANADANDWDALSAAAQASYRHHAVVAGKALYPELASGSHWLAPMEATEGMIKAAAWATNDSEMFAVDAWDDFRDAFLSQPDKDKT